MQGLELKTGVSFVKIPGYQQRQLTQDEQDYYKAMNAAGLPIENDRDTWQVVDYYVNPHCVACLMPGQKNLETETCIFTTDGDNFLSPLPIQEVAKLLTDQP